MATRQARFYWFPVHNVGGSSAGEAVSEDALHDEAVAYACARGHHPVPVHGIFVSAEFPPCNLGCLPRASLETIALSGTMLAYQTVRGHSDRYHQCRAPCADWLIRVRDLATGSFLRSVPTGPVPKSFTDDNGYHPIGAGPAVRVVATPNGSVAWTVANVVRQVEQERLGLDVPISYELRRVGAQGEQVLASGIDLDPHSLTMRGSRLEWVQGGSRKSATLR
jgi:hypothetical protein